MLGTLSACATRGTPPIVDSLCAVDAPLTFAVPPREAQDDAGNRWDTMETVNAIIAHNVALSAACGGQSSNKPARK